MSRRQALVAVIGAALASTASTACGPRPPAPHPRYEMSNHASTKAPDISNHDLAWDGTPLGLQPRITDRRTAELVTAPASLDDPR